jgi:hypothetical protein
MISNIKFIIENSLWLLKRIKILDLAIIISAAIRILRIIKVDDMISIDDKGDIDIFVWFK